MKNALQSIKFKMQNIKNAMKLMKDASGEFKIKRLFVECLIKTKNSSYFN